MSTELKVYRFNFRQEFATNLYKFSQVHQYDSCKDFKDAFSKWEEQNQELIQREIEHLCSAGYVGDFRSKVFKSARYYFRKKTGEGMLFEDVGETETLMKAKKQPTLRKKYTSINGDLSAKIAEYLDLEENHKKKPSDGFEMFCELYREEVDAEVSRLEAEEEDCNGLLKIKKTFKNKHFNKKQEILQQRDDRQLELVLNRKI